MVGRKATPQWAKSCWTKCSPNEEIQAVGGDRAYDSDTVRALIAAAGKEAVIPPRCNRRQPAAYDKEKYKQRNKAERLFNKLKGYRGIATRYDKLAAVFLGGVLATLLAVSLKCIVNTPQLLLSPAHVVIQPGSYPG